MQGADDRRHVVVVIGDRRCDLVLHLDDTQATIGDVVDAVHRATGASDPVAGASIDGRWVPSHLAVRDARLVDGCELVIGAAPRVAAPGSVAHGSVAHGAVAHGAVAAAGGCVEDTPRPAGGVVLAVTEGPAAGVVWPVGDAPLTIGRSAQVDVVLDDPTVSGHHATIAVTPGVAAGAPVALAVRDLGSCNGTWIDDRPVAGDAFLRPGQVLRLGASHLRVDRADDAQRPPDPPSTSGTVPVNRPPRPVLPKAPDPVALPIAPTPVAPARKLSVVSVVAPLLLAGGLVWWTGNPRFALFLLLSPVLAVGTWWSARHQARRRRRADAQAGDRALASLRRDLDELVDAEVARRRVLLPDVAEVLRRIRPPGRRLWERRDGHDDHLRMRVGVGTVPWDPPVRADARHGGAHADDPDGVAAAQAGAVAAEVARASRLPRCPVEVDQGAGEVVGIVGDRAAARALARSLVVQAAVHHGPADLAVAAFTDDARAWWAWVKWLPHARWSQTGTSVVVGAPQREQVLAEWHAQAATSTTTLLTVVDDARLVHGRGSPLRAALAGEAGRVAGIVLADRIDELPAVTSTVITLHGSCGDGELHRPGDGSHVDDLVIGGLGLDVAERSARGLARFDDPELDGPTAGIPTQVRLWALLDVGMEAADAGDAGDAGDSPADVAAAAAAVRRRWAAQPVDPTPATPIGVGAHGVVEVDLVADGPHGLLVGTTGSGKSELLRSLVVGLASRVDPGHLTFVLIDYKGGSAFDGCAALPHTVGVVTDLDEHLGARALRSLEAEVRHRERILRQAGVVDLPAYLRAGAPCGALPRLVVVVDEFATLAAELPDLLAALVGLAQRGRSLGIHLLLATQRPGGALNASITANTDLRIALRVQTAADAVEVLDRPDAASVPRSLPGRGYVRTAGAGTIAVQTAWSSATAPAQRWPVRATPFDPAATSTWGEAAAAHDVAVSDLDRLVAAIGEAAAEGEHPRRPWLPPLPEVIDHDDIEAVLGRPLDPTPGVVIGVADDPDRQRRVPATWRPADGHLAVFGMVGSGTTTALRGLAHALAARSGADTCHLHAVEMAPGGLVEVAQLPITGTYTGPADAELRRRLLRHLGRELERRRGLTPAQLADEPWTVVLIDGVGALLADLDAPEAVASSAAVTRVLAEGPAVRIVVAMAGARVGELPLRHAMSVARRLLLRHADAHELTGVGLRSHQLPTFVPGRAVEADGTVVQLARPAVVEADGAAPRAPTGHGLSHGLSDGAPRLVERLGAGGPVRLRPLPHHLDVEVLPAGHIEAGGLQLPIGLAEEDLAPLALELPPSGHALIAGPPRSGVTSTLAVIAAQARAADERAVLIGICAPGSPLYDSEVLDAAGPLEDLVHVVPAASTDDRRWVVLIDRAPRVADVAGVLAGLLASGRGAVHVVAGGRADELRGAFAHWTRDLRTSRCGVLLRPDLAADGEVIGSSLPRRVPVALDRPGRGFVVTDGVAALAQLAVPMTAPAVRRTGLASHGAPPAARAS